jgi:metallo-beta-lactamase family protein
VAAASIGDVVLTHAHIDHTGYLPRLFGEGFRGAVHGTRATADLVRILLPDSGHLQEEEAAYHNRHRSSKHVPALPLYTEREAAAAAHRVRGAPYGEPFDAGEAFAVSFRRAGHILGAAITSIDLPTSAGRRRVVFSGDLGRYGAPILCDPSPIGEADYIVVESTYGDRRHAEIPVPELLQQLVNAAVSRGGAIIVPAFAVGRTQDLMYHLSGLETQRRIPRLRSFIDSPMAIDATAIYCAHPEEFDAEMRALVLDRKCPLHSGDFRLARTPDESRALNDLTGPMVIISASGMATGGRVLHHLKRRLPDPRTTVMLVGYQALGTRGRLLQDGARTLRIFGEDVPVRAHIEVVQGLSAHADADGILRWLRTAARAPRRLFVVHGDPDPAAALGARVRSELGWDVVVPAYGDRAELT